ncbi:MAG: penicillin-binding protein, partial [Actinobacteria bacterium]|nr:penicillin-binding protein [Actinomycetota bacterium]
MRARCALLLVVTLATESCALGTGVAPEPVPTTTTASTTTTTSTTIPAGLSQEERAAAAQAAADYLGAWAAFDWDLASRFVTGPPSGFAAAHQAWAQSLGAVTVAFTVGDVGPADEGAGALVGFSAAVEVGGAGTWEYQGSAPLVRAGSRWLVDWSPRVLLPSLEEGDTLRLARTWATRGALLAVDGRPIAAEQPVKVIGVVPGRVEDLDALAPALFDLAGIDPGYAVEQIERPGVQPDWFIPVGTLGAGEYPAVKDALEALPGVLVRDGSQRVSLPSPFADHVVGSTGPITAEILTALGPPYSAAEVVGRSGLERALERRLAGRPSQELQRVNRYGRVVEVLATFEAVPPEDITTTLDIDVQGVVEQVISGAPEPAAVVVVDVATGGIRGIASRPLEAFDRALGGAYPPGSTLKTVTAAALLAQGVTPLQVVDCPAEVVVGGRRFTNAGGDSRGQITFADAFAYSCNTTFAPLGAAMLDEGELAETAASFGFGTPPDLPLPATTAAFPEPIDDTEQAAAAIGQGRVLTSPLHMASVAAAVAGGGWRRPALLAGDPATPLAMDPGVRSALADLMLRVVTYGTGTPAAVDGEEVRG